MNIKMIGIYLGRLATYTLHIFPIKQNKMAFCSYSGRDISCNPYYFNKYLLDCPDFSKWEYVWFVNNPDEVYVPECLQGKIKIVRTKSVAYFYHAVTAKYVIYNLGLPIGSLISKQKKQVWIHTWHGGGAFKKVGQYSKKDKVQEKIDIISSKSVDLFLSTNKTFSEVIPHALKIAPEKFCEIGMPRNDVLFHNMPQIIEKVRKFYGLSKDDKIVIYAPTYRGDFKNAKNIFELDYKMLEKVLHKKFGGKWIIMERKHYAVNEKCSNMVIDASKYPDMQELLAAADVLVTDYSSSIWDFAFTGKPGFLFTPDLNEYRKNVNFYTEIEVWPYTFARTNEELGKKILEYSQDDAEQKRKAYFSLVGNCETGTACEKLMEFIKTGDIGVNL